MDKITRTIISSRIKLCTIRFEKGDIVKNDLDDILIVGKKMDKVDAEKLVSKKFPDVTDTIVIKEILTTEKLYELSIEDFLKYATVVIKNNTDSETPQK